MKNLKKMILLVLCVGMIGSMTACGNKNDKTNGADQGTSNNGNVNGATAGTDKNNDGKNGAVTGGDTKDRKDDNGLLDDAVDGATNGIDDMVDGVTDGVDDVMDGVTDGVDDVTDGVTRDGAGVNNAGQNAGNP
ncbi:MAG: hypothetical protein HFH23_01845 [Ruminococcus sp.]|jgi:hypothetical protein|nr:hypothetical protein [Ruminococcus sp.]